MKLRSIDLFAGAGGMSEGLRMAGFDCLWANEIDKFASVTFSQNFPAAVINTDDIKTLCAADIRNQLDLAVGEIDLVVGGPPCQGFSTYGQRDSFDPRNQLYRNFFDFVKEFRPKCFVMENVAGLLSMSGGAVIEDVLSVARGLGYNTHVHSVRAEQFGVPQRRRRVFIIGSTLGPPPLFVPAEFVDAGGASGEVADLFSGLRMSKVRTVKDAISDLLLCETLPPASTSQSMAYRGSAESEYQVLMRGDMAEITHHSAKRMLGVRRLRLALLRPGDYGEQLRNRIQGDGLPYGAIDEILMGHAGARDLKGCRRQDVEKEIKLREMLHEGRHSVDEVMLFIDHGGFKNKYRKLSWDEPSHTLVAHMARDCSDFVHPELDRFISVREAARLQSFPDDFKLPGSQFQQFKQLGNAVPPLLARAVGFSIVEHLKAWF
ncbi:MAG: DNA cytosine methyltransferase [Pseudomonas sp.]|uniref:DNA cytosine methyltransferase n=1 Tax=Pseudomonas sp. TaxID=306 RepID=UPI0027331267|nr:DNA cytosine methyltransferase [Pseudomonas sp.]MDP3846874.1 DNA cytosine methyltransferase [Pseudomonas sp.]